MLRSQVLFLDSKSALQQGLDLVIDGRLLREVRDRVGALWGIRLYQLLDGAGRWQVPVFDLVMEVLLLRGVRAVWGISVLRLHQFLAGAGRWKILGLDLVIDGRLVRKVGALCSKGVLRFQLLFAGAGS